MNIPVYIFLWAFALISVHYITRSEVVGSQNSCEVLPLAYSVPPALCLLAGSRVLGFQRELCRWSPSIFLKVSEQEVGIVSGKNMGHQVGQPWGQEQS